jgi:hypothetical protein
MSNRVFLVLWLLIAAVIAVPIGSSEPVANASTAAFLSYPRQAAPLTVSGSNIVIANKSWVGFGARGPASTFKTRTNVYIHDVDFAGCGGGIFLSTSRHRAHRERPRRNIGDGTIGSGHGNLIQLNNVWQSAPSSHWPRPHPLDLVVRRRHRRRHLGYKSGGIDAAHPLVIGNVHLEHPLSGPLAWKSDSGRAPTLRDAAGTTSACRTAPS